ncbi:MAG: hypothetical protein F6K34_01210 [Okeania sp. SIO4D6]|uniref:hypothetical protein n=1 Tax=unclassified Okeania TaxID=2634635 RepID=UPI0013B967F9|nr:MULTISPECIES: hypothetical protein [unclassified Okeania]NEP03547.1 hypothetical protein [Okeania sp. SIO4D6]NEP75712.1 hypothetical protein [Okeania sp. SIO2G5]NEP96589.1 hypothetical protein [Okeania sp. SIO2F5]
MGFRVRQISLIFQDYRERNNDKNIPDDLLLSGYISFLDNSGLKEVITNKGVYIPTPDYLVRLLGAYVLVLRGEQVDVMKEINAEHPYRKLSEYL